MRNERLYQWNRFYLLVSVMLSIVIPSLFLPVSIPHIALPTTTGYYLSYAVSYPAIITDVSTTSEALSIQWEWYGFMAYLSVFLLLLLRKVVFFIRILNLKNRSTLIHTSEANLYYTDDAAAPFTFFRSVFWKKDVPFDSGEGRCMFRHELAHVRLGHSRDKILMQLVCCIFWMNPFFLLFRRELELVHEFAADS
jgi:hypothetical protein